MRSACGDKMKKEEKYVDNQDITQLMSCVHGPNNRCENKDYGYWYPTTLVQI